MDNKPSSIKSDRQSRSQRSRSRGASSRNGARSNSRAPSLTRVHSARAFDDHSTYHEYDHEPISTPEPHDTTPPEKDNRLSHHSSESHESYEKEEYESGEGIECVKEVREGVPDERDVELGGKVSRTPSTKSQKDPFLVAWKGEDDPEYPKNWSMKRRWGATFIVSCFTLVSPVSSSITAPALNAIGRDLHITNQVELELTFSIFVLAYAVGPLFLGPLSEMYGRVRVIQLGNLFYLAFNIGCGFCQTKTQMIVFRFLAGIGGGTPQTAGGGVLSDLWRAEERGKAIGIYTLAPLLGPALGPICGGFIAEYTTWRWAFWSTSIVTVVVQICGVIWLRETYTPILLKRKAAKLRQETGDDRYHSEYDDQSETLVKKLGTALQRPFRLLTTQPIIQVIAVYMAYLYGLMYLLISTFPTLFEDIYHERVSIAGLNYISMGLGFAVSTQIAARFNDKLYRRLKQQNNNVGKPEFRIPLVIPASIVLPISLFWYGWSAQARIHWIMPNIGIFLFSGSCILCFQCMQSYIIDSYTRYAASGIAAVVVLRATAGFGFPLFAPYMYSALGNGWGNSLLAFIAIVVGIPAPFMFWRYGERLRAKSPYAAGG